jgi:AcrR family transcriptional regulator
MGEDRDPAPGAPFAFRRPGDALRLGELGPRKHAVQERSRETVEVVLEAAAQVFERVGFTAATTEQIAERAGVSVGTLYQYWPSKEALAVALMERHGEAGLARAAPVLRELGDATIPLEKRIESLARVFVEMHDERPDLHWALESEAPLPLAYRERIGELTRQLASFLEGALSTDPDRALLVACALDALPHALIRPATRLDTEASVRELTRMLLAYLRD